MQNQDQPTFKVKRYTFGYVEGLKQIIRERPNYDWKSYFVAKFKDPKEIVLFAYLCLPGAFLRPFSNAHYDFFDFLQIGIRKGKKNKAAKLSRGFGKSTITTKLGVIYETCNNIHKYILINSHNDTQSIDKLTLIREEFETNNILKWLYGEPNQNKSEWQKSSIVVFDRVRIQTISTGQAARGFLWRDTRPSKVVSDDILEDKQVQNPVIREETKNTFLKTLVPALTTDGFIEFINTPLHPDDLIEQVFKGQGLFDPALWDTLHIPALIDGKSIDENWMSTEKLLQMQNADGIMFSQEYLGIPIGLTSGMVKEEMLVSLPSVNLKDYEQIFIHCDLIQEGGAKSDYFSIGGIAQNKDKYFDLLDFKLTRPNIEEQAEITIQTYISLNKYGKVTKITYDEVSQKSFGYWVVKLAREKYGISLPLQPSKYRKGKLAHFQTHYPHFVAKRIRFDFANPHWSTAKQQLLAFPQKGVHDDFVDMVCGCLDNFHLPPNEELQFFEVNSQIPAKNNQDSEIFYNNSYPNYDSEIY